MNVERQGYEKKTAKANRILPTLQVSSTPQRFYKRRLRTTGYPLKQIVVSLLSLTLSFSLLVALAYMTQTASTTIFHRWNQSFPPRPFVRESARMTSQEQLLNREISTWTKTQIHNATNL
jgi:hypothetical protein